MDNTVNDLLGWADSIPQDALLEEPLKFQTEVEERLELEDALQHTVVVSDETRLACAMELAAAKVRKYRV